MCSCADVVNESLAKEGRRLSRLYAPVGAAVLPHVLIATEPISLDERTTPVSRKKSKVFASYCPFCGRKYGGGRGQASGR
jgi:hypothetical protein